MIEIARNTNLGDTSPFGPSLIQIATDGPGPALIMAWTGSDGAGTLNSSYSNTGGHTWEKTVIHGETSVAGPSLTRHNDSVFVAWSGTNPAHNLNVMTSSDHGKHWGNGPGRMTALHRNAKYTLSGRSMHAPSLLSYGGQLLLVWTDLDHSVRLARSEDDGRTWTTFVLPNESLAGPCLAGYSAGAGFRHLFIGFAGLDGRLNLRSCEGFGFDALASGGAATPLDDWSTEGPSLAVLNEGQGKDIFLAMTYSGRDIDRKIYTTYSLQGLSPFGNRQRSDDSAIGTPATFTFREFPAQNDELVCAWAGTDGEGHLSLSPASRLF